MKIVRVPFLDKEYPHLWLAWMNSSKAIFLVVVDSKDLFSLNSLEVIHYSFSSRASSSRRQSNSLETYSKHPISNLSSSSIDRWNLFVGLVRVSSSFYLGYSLAWKVKSSGDSSVNVAVPFYVCDIDIEYKRLWFTVHKNQGFCSRSLIGLVEGLFINFRYGWAQLCDAGWSIWRLGMMMGYIRCVRDKRGKRHKYNIGQHEWNIIKIKCREESQAEWRWATNEKWAGPQREDKLWNKY